MSLITLLAILAMGLLLGLMGGGGSILSVPILIYLMELPEKSAIATSLLVVGTTSLISLLIYLYRRQVDVRVGAVFGVFSMAGAYMGGWLARFIPPAVLVSLFAVMMLVAAFAMLKGRKAPAAAAAETTAQGLPIARIGVQGVGVGVVTGLVGAGGGFLVVPALVLLSGLDMKRAVATSLMVIVLNSYAAFAGYVSHTPVDLSIAWPVIGVAVAGALGGITLGTIVPGQKLRKAFGVFVLMMGVFVLGRELPIDLPPWLTVVSMLVAGAVGVMFSAWIQKSNAADAAPRNSGTPTAQA